MTDAYSRSVKAIRVRQVEEFQRRRESGVMRDLPPIQELFERGLVAAWRAHQSSTPLSVEAMRQYDPELTEMQIAELCESPMFIEALTARGIPYADTLGRLDAEQLFVLQAMVDPSIDSPVMARLRKLGVSYTRWTGWLRQPAFAATYSRMIEQAKVDIVGPTLVNLHRKAQEDVPAMKLVLEMSGEYTPGGVKGFEEAKYKKVIEVLMEAVQTHVKDPAVLVTIGNAVQAAASGQNVEVAEFAPAAVIVPPERAPLAGTAVAVPRAAI